MILKITLIIGLFFSNICLAGTVNIKAIVNGKIITSYDLDERVKLSKELLKQSGIEMEEKEIEKNLLLEMINNEIKMQEASKYNIKVTDEEIKDAIKRMEQSLKLETNGSKELLKKAGVDESVLKAQISSDIIWMKFIMHVLRGYVKVQKKDIELFINKMTKDDSYTFSLIPLMIKQEKLKEAITKTKDITTCDSFTQTATEIGLSGSGVKMEMPNLQMQKDLYDLTKDAPLLTPLKPIKINDTDAIFFICAKEIYKPVISDKDKEQIKFIILQNKLETFANKYFAKIKANSTIDIK